MYLLSFRVSRKRRCSRDQREVALISSLAERPSRNFLKVVGSAEVEGMK